MSQEIQGNDSAAPVSVLPAKRGRGRPRKDHPSYMEKASTTPGSDVMRRNRRRSVDSTAHADNALVGQIVSGVLDGSFDAGYLLTVKVGNTNTLLRGVVFEPGLSVPITVGNDVAPHVKMLRRSEIPLPMINPLNQVLVSTPYYEVKNEQPAKPVPKTVTVIQLEGSPSDNNSPPKGSSNDANHGSQVAAQVNQSSIKAESLATLLAKGRPDGVHQTLPIASQASQSNIDKGKSTELSNKTSLSPKGAVLNCNQSPPTAVQTADKSDVTALINKSSDDFNRALLVVANAPPSEPRTENLVVVLQESETSLQTTRLSNGSSSTKDLKLEPKTEQSVEMSSEDENDKEVLVANNLVPQVQTQVLASAQNPDLSVDALRGVQAEVGHSPLEAPIEMSQENKTSPFNGPAYADIQAYFAAPHETMSELSNEILKRDGTTQMILGSLTDAINTTKDDLHTHRMTCTLEIQSGFAANQPTPAQDALGLQISDPTAPSQDESLIAKDVVSMRAPSKPVESVTSTDFMETEATDHTQVKEVEVEAALEGPSGM